MLGCCLLTAVEARSARCCYAQSQEQLAAASPSAKQREVPHNEAPEPDSSSRFSQPAASPADYNNSLGLHLIKNIALDQTALWTSPRHLRMADADWLVPLGMVLGGTLGTDTAFSKSLSNSPGRIKYSKDLSNYGIAGMAAAGGGLYLWGRMAHDDHKSETGILAGEAAIDSFSMVSGWKYAFGRERPRAAGHSGTFWSGGDSFPSEHAAAAWSIASVIAHEYPGPLTQFLAYGAATAISVSRVTGKQHFPSDVVAGSAIGWLVGREIYRAHHNPELGGGGWNDRSRNAEADERRGRRQMGSAFVPLDSWVYPAFERLAALGYIHTSLEGVRPWTRIECARLAEEADDTLHTGGAASEQAAKLQERLAREFAYEVNLASGSRNLTANLESVYARTVSLSGPALTDGYHFGQTISYDFGRPFERGTNFQDGGSFRATAGPVAIYVRAEFQHAPSAPALPVAAREFIGAKDAVPVPAGVSIAAIDRPRLLDAYLAMNLNNWQIVLGKQSLSWAHGPGGSLLWSDNAEPVNMVRVVNVEPIRLPSVLKFLGPARIDQFFGRLGGHDFVPRPFIYGQKINFKPFPCLELGFGRTTILGGKGGTPLTGRNLLRSAFGLVDPKAGSVPGDSHSSMDWTFYVPKARNYLVFYGELYNDDDPTPLRNPPQSPYRPGLYITRIPGIAKLDLHIEAASTQSYGWNSGGRNGGNFNYWNSVYRDGYTNNSNLLGNTVGRMGQAYQAWLTYWISPRQTLQLTYKNSRVDAAFVPGGGAWQDYGVRTEMYWKSGLYLKTQVQYENISHYPILFQTPRSNVSAALEFGFSPHERASDPSTRETR